MSRPSWDYSRLSPRAMHWLLVLMLALAPAAAQGAASGDPFLACMDETGGDGRTCLARQGDWYGWAASESACRFVGEKVDAIIAAGGDAKWADLFRNERCARLGLPHGPVAADAGDKIVNNHRYALCLVRNSGFGSRCNELLGRHALFPPNIGSCEHNRDSLRERYLEQKKPYDVDYAFENERCWRLGLPHFEPD